MRRNAVLALVFTIVAGAPFAARAAEEAAAGVAIEPTWKTVVLAPGRVVANGRFDAARASYHAERAEKRAAAGAERPAACPCECGKR
jgi:hypothetical protein